MGWKKINEQPEMWWGDGPADEMGDALEKIAAIYQEVFGRPPFLEELEHCFHFVAEAHYQRLGDELCKVCGYPMGRHDDGECLVEDHDSDDGAAPADVIEPEPRVARCGNCGKEWERERLDAVRNPDLRIDEGGELPMGECPECGALCYDADGVDDPATDAQHDSRGSK